MYSYDWDPETGGFILKNTPLTFSKEPRPVYYRELDLLGFREKLGWNYAPDDSAPYLWAEASNYFYRGRKVAMTKGGTLYAAPDLIAVEDPEPNGAPMQLVDISGMVEKNRDIMEALVQDTIKQVYNAYMEYKDKVDVFHVSYSGGKDSEVMLDIVQRAIPHDDFVVIFGDTQMEFPDTYDSVEQTMHRCRRLDIKFYTAKSHIDPKDAWRIFGPPASNIRWCCSTMKTAPQLLKLREIMGKSDFREMAFVGVRASESLRRSEYDYISVGTKHKGQYSCNPILEWNSAEIYAYIYENNLPLNDTYRKGNSRAGCLVCPMSGDKSDYMRHCCYPDEVDAYIDIVREVSTKSLETAADNKRYIETGGWKMRTNGRDISTLPETYFEKLTPNGWEIKVIRPATDWRQWIKTAGVITQNSDNYRLENYGVYIEFTLTSDANGYHACINQYKTPKHLLLTKMLKEVFRKSAYCCLCRECEADCQHGFIHMNDGKLTIDDACLHCGNCHKPASGCLLYKSIEQPKGVGNMDNKSLDSYADHAPKMEWFKSLFSLEDEFYENNTLGSEMKNKFARFLRDAQFAEKNATTSFGKLCFRLGLDDPAMWALMLVNLAYSPEVGWFINNVEWDREYTREELIEKLQAVGVKDRGARSITGSFKRILDLPFGSDVGLGEVTTVAKQYVYNRRSWENPEGRVILYALYKFAEACEGYYSFSLDRLLDETIESAGISPTKIFGLDRETMERVLTGLSINYPDFIHANFAVDLDVINLRENKTAADVLTLFE